MYQAPACDNRTISEELPKLENYIPMIIAISEAFTIQQTDVPRLSFHQTDQWVSLPNDNSRKLKLLSSLMTH